MGVLGERGVSAVDRMAAGYEPSFDIDLKLGQQGELYVAEILASIETGNGEVEVKTDEKALTTGNVYVEYECKKFGGWQKSGISITGARFWAFVIGGDVVVFVPVERLKATARRLFHQSSYFQKECSRGSHPTKGVVIPLRTLFLELFKEAA